MATHLIMYTRTGGCPYVSVAKRVLNEHSVAYEEVFIDRDSVARQNVQNWTGFLSVPTIVVAEEGSQLPIEAPEALAEGSSPRGIDRGYMITEPNVEQLINWLKKHQFITHSENENV